MPSPKKSLSRLKVEEKSLPQRPLAVITGGASLIGAGVAECLIADGWNVVLADIDLAAARAAAKKLGADATAAKLDISNQEAVQTFFAATLKARGPIDGLINAAGGLRGLGIPHKPFVKSTPKEWDKIIGVNLEGVMNCIHAVLPSMMENKRGVIVSMGASRGYRGQANAAVHSGTKGGLIVFCQNLACELGPYNIRINTILPGFAAARWKGRAKDGGSRRLSPLGKPTSPADVGNMVAYLMSEKGSHITGACLDVSGGTALH